MSTATETPAARSRGTSRAYQSVGASGGNEPHRAAQRDPVARSSRRASRASTSSARRGAPGSLSFVVVPSGSVIVRLVRTGWAVRCSAYPTPAASSRRCSGSSEPTGSTAVAATPAIVTTRATLTPLPPGSSWTSARRRTAPRDSGPGRAAERSTLGLAVKVVIMR